MSEPVVIPHPGMPEHVDNLATITLLEAQGFEGTDVSLSISVFEYDLVWRYLKPEECDGEEEELLVIYPHPNIPKRWDRTSMNPASFEKDFKWADFAKVAEFAGVPLAEWLEYPYHVRLVDLYRMHGAENVFGSSYWEGFEIKDE
jgi:hypothetical protein